MSRRLLTAVLALPCLLLLSSCLDYEEDMIVHSDLSGQVLITLTLPDTLTSKYEKLGIELDRAKIEKRLETTSGVSLASYESTGGRKPKITMLIKFTSLEKLSEAIAANPPAAIVGGIFAITNENGLTKVERKLGVGDVGPMPLEMNLALYKTHFDGKIVSTNSTTYNQHAQDVRYRYKLSDMVALRPVQSTTLAKPWPWLVILICLAAVSFAAWYGWQQFGKSKPKATA